MKKKILIFMVLLLFVNIWLPSTSEAAVAGKVVNQAAKKVAKEIIIDTTIDMSFNMVMDYKYVPKDQREPKPGHEFICLPADKKSDGDCGNPRQIKKITTQADREALGKAVEKSLDKKIAGGIGTTKWGKFLDWFVPIFSVGLGVAVIDYAFNGDVSDLFDEIGFDALQDMGLIEGVNEGSPSSILHVYEIVDTYYRSAGDGRVTLEAKEDYHYVGSGGNIYKTSKGSRLTIEAWNMTDNKVYIKNSSFFVDGTLSKTVGGKITLSESPTQRYKLDYSSSLTIVNLAESNGFKPNLANPPKPAKQTYSETGGKRTNNVGTQKKVIAPGAFPMVKTKTSEPVYPYVKPDGTIGIRDKGGIEISEDDVTVLDPEIIQNPDGSKTVKKAPTMTSEGEIEKPDDSKDGIIPPTGTDPNGNPNEWPEGQSCDAQLKLPRFSALMRSLSETFPFSIPWDLKSGFDALFSEMGNNKPEFEYKFDFQGKEKAWKIVVPKYFDSWMPFVHSILLFIFDVGILYGIHRLIKGGG